MTKSIEKDNGHRMVHGAAGHRARRTVLLKYVIARHGGKGPELLHFPLGFDEVTLPVFSSRRAAQSFVFSNALEREWHTRETSAGELISLLLGPYATIQRVLLDSPGHPATGDISANLMRWDNFVDYLLEQCASSEASGVF